MNKQLTRKVLTFGLFVAIFALSAHASFATENNSNTDCNHPTSYNKESYNLPVKYDDHQTYNKDYKDYNWYDYNKKSVENDKNDFKNYGQYKQNFQHFSDKMKNNLSDNFHNNYDWKKNGKNDWEKK